MKDGLIAEPEERSTIFLLGNKFKSNLAGYMVTPVACGWAGAIVKATPSFGQEQ